MALVVKDRVKQTTTTTGTGSVVLNGTVSGFQTFAAALSNGDTTYYAIFEPSTNEYEVGLGTWTESTATLARTTILESSNSGSAVSLTAQAEVFITQPAEKAVYLDASNNVTLTNNLTVSGDFTVSGTTTTIDTTNSVVTDSLIELSNGTTGTPANDAGIVIERGDSDNAFIGYDESADKFTVGTGSFTGASTGNLTISTGTLVANVEGNLTGNVTGNVSGSSGSTTGNAATATALQTARTIAGQSFDGTANITIAPTDLTGVTSTAAELNILDGVTSTTAELNLLDGVTATTTELNYVDGVTSAIQTQLDAKAPINNPTFTGSISHAGDLTIDVGGYLNLDADNAGGIFLKDGGTTYGQFNKSLSSFVIKSNISDGDLIFKGNDGGSEITALTLDMSDAGTAIFNHDIKLADNGKAIFGAGSDLQIYHDGTDSYISDQGTGDLRVLAGQFNVKSASGNTDMIYAVNGGAVTLYNNGNAKIATTSTGVDITGTVTADLLNVTSGSSADNIVQVFGAGTIYAGLGVDGTGAILTAGSSGSADAALIIKTSASGTEAERLRITSDGNIGVGTSTVSLNSAYDRTIHIHSTLGSLIKLTDATSGTTDTDGTELLNYGNDTYLINRDVGNIIFNVTSAERMRITSDGDVGINKTTIPNTGSSEYKSVVISNEAASKSARFVAMGAASAYTSYAVLTSGTHSGSTFYSPSLIYTDTLRFYSAPLNNEPDDTNLTERMRLTTTGLGIGTSSPSAKLEVNGGTDNEPIKVVSTDAGSYVSVADNGTTGSTRFGAVSNDFKIDVNSAERLRIDSSGNVGIGMSSPSDFAIGNLVVGSGSGAEGITIYSGNAVGEEGIIRFADGTTGADQYQGQIKYEHNSNFMRFYTAATERMRIDSSGSVGIGNTNPSDYNSNGNNLVVGTTSGNNGISIASATSGFGSIYFADGTSGVAQYRGIVQYDHASDSMRFFTTSAERMRISSNGDVGIGTTAPSSFSGYRYLDIVGGSTSTGGVLQLRTSDFSVNLQAYTSSVGGILGTTTNHGLIFITNNSTRVLIDTSGNLLLGTTTTNPSGNNDASGVELSSAGQVNASRSGANALDINRGTSHGEIARFRKDGTTVGSIGTFNAAHLYFAGSNTGIKPESNVIYGTNSSGSALDNTIDIGASAYRFKDLYLSGSLSDGTTSRTVADIVGLPASRLGPTYEIPNTGNSASWVKLGNFAAAQTGISCLINVVTNSGYNADDTQNSQTVIRFKTSNNISNQSGFYGDVQAYKTGPNGSPADVRVVQVSTTSFDIWCYFGTYSGDGSFYTVNQTDGTWTHSGSTGTPSGTSIDATINTMWHSGNDGSGSTLDADLLDGVQGSSYLRSDAADSASNTITISTGTNPALVAASHDWGEQLEIKRTNSTVNWPSIKFSNDAGEKGRVFVDASNNYLMYLKGGASNYETVWTSLTDGSGSGLDADLLDGNHASAFQTASTALGYVDVATGNYGTIKVDDDRGTGWAGYAIQDDWVFMGRADDAGIYNDTDNEWVLYAVRNGATFLYYNGVYKLETNSGGVAVTGALTATGDITAYYSDERLKNFEGKIDGALDKVSKLSGYYYRENDKAKELGYENDARQVGVSAQEVEAVMPEVVKPAPVDPEYKTVQYEKLVPLLIEAIKELKEEVRQLKEDKA